MTAVRTKNASKPLAKAPASASHETHESEGTSERLIAAATVLFSQRGFDGVSVKELADSAGVNVSLVSYHFGGKENLYRACLEQFGKGRLTVAQRILQPPQTREELRFRLKMFLEEMFACHLESRDAAQMVHRECEAELPHAPDIFRDTFLKVFETMFGFFRAAQEAGIVRAELDPMLTAHLFFGGIKHVLNSDKISQKFFGLTISDESYRAKVVDHIVQCSLFGITYESESKPSPRPPERSNA